MEDECTSLASLTQLALSLQKLIALRLRIWSLCASVKFCSFLGLCLQNTLYTRKSGEFYQIMSCVMCKSYLK